MTTLYSVIRYVPDVFADERINIGVMVWGEGRVRAQFVTDWRRVERFGRRDVAFLREFAVWVESDDGQAPLSIDGSARFSETLARQVAGRWGGSIQLSDPRPSMRTVDATLRAIAARFLRDPRPQAEEADDREAAVREATRRIRGAVEGTIGREALENVRSEWDVGGDVSSHRFDVVVSNDNEAPLGIVRAMSFRVERGESVRQQVDAFAWAAQDVRARLAKQKLVPRIVAYVIPPKGPSEVFDHAHRTMHHLRITMCDADTFSAWVDGVVGELGRSLPRRMIVR